MKTQINIFLSTFKYCFNLSWETSSIYTIIRLLSFILLVLIPYLPIYLTKFIIDDLTNASAIEISYPAMLLLLLIMARICSQLLSQISSYAQNLHNELMEKKINESLIHKTSTMDISFFDTPDYLDTLQAVLSDSQYLIDIVWNIFIAISQLVSMLVSAIAIAQYYWLYSFAIIAVTIPSAIATRKYAKVLYLWRIDHMAEERKSVYIRNITSDKQFASDIRLFNLSPYLMRRYRDLWEYCYHGRKKLRKKQLVFLIMTSMLPEACLFFFLLSIIENILLSRSTVGDLSLFIGLFTSLSSALNYFIQSVASIYEDRLKAETVRKFYNKSNIVSDCGTVELSGKVCVKFDNVSFRYPSSEKFVLENVSFSIKENEKVCLIGINGAGKSTIIKLLLRFYDVTNGQILVNGRDIREYSLQSLRSTFSTFFQNYKTYAFTFGENITLSNLEENDNSYQFQQALHLSGAHEVAAKLSKGYETFIHRVFDVSGYEPSGGEAQKISLARTIYRKCNMIIFDEPSAALDPVAESALFENMKQIWQDKSALFTSHRLAAVHMADKILMLEDGHIIESGTHNDLISINGKYKHLYNLQAQKYAL